ncbi:PREDICTED: peroxidase 28-like [Camelina sativa]|uniref:Peroxidase n=1 Tax=Camelina sativa TaxID=90675 RepID=A0ABM0W036_CAMSA|nr:PREDICTED: peroxidase 28-like [Camelina sativa]
MKIANFSVILLIFLIFPVAIAQLRFGFYSQSCPNAETIVQNLVRQQFARDPSITAALTRMHFHDCFVQGCDASLLIDPTTTQPSPEKTARPNGSVRGFELIDEIKTALEAQCPLKVSCSDIITLATRESVFLGGGPSYPVPTGRRDGFVSNLADAEQILPGPGISVAGMLGFFGNKGMDVFDAVALLGAHTVGVASCGNFGDRVTNFQGTGQPDPTMDPSLVASLRNTCAAPGGFAALDQSTPFSFDNLFFSQLRQRKGILFIDQRMATDPATSDVVSQYAANNELFKRQFAIAMVKMGAVDVLTGLAGEIRGNCRAFN